jgi:hypothetical protein
MSQRVIIHGFGSGRSRGSLNLPDGRLACTETFFVNVLRPDRRGEK